MQSETQSQNKGATGPFDLQRLRLNPDLSLSDSELVDEWHVLIKRYMMRKTTRPSDRLAAIAGIAEKFRQKMSDNRYLCGLWLCDVVSSLAWKLDNVGVLNEASKAPSWSWASIEGNSYHSEVDSYYSALESSQSTRIIQVCEKDESDLSWIRLAGPLVSVHLHVTREGVTHHEWTEYSIFPILDQTEQYIRSSRKARFYLDCNLAFTYESSHKGLDPVGNCDRTRCAQCNVNMLSPKSRQHLTTDADDGNSSDNRQHDMNNPSTSARRSLTAPPP